MVRKLMVGCMLALLVSSCFAGYSSGGGRSGFSGGSRSFGSSRSYSSGRSGFSRSSNTYARPRAYVAPRSYSYPSHNTVVNNHHYSNGGYGGGGFGHGLLGGMLGGYIGGSLANNHGTTVIAGGSGQPYVGDGQGAIMDSGYPVVQSQSSNVGIIIFWMVIGFIALFLLFAFVTRDDCSHRHNRW